MCYENGTAVDDLIVYRMATDRYVLVVNAGNLDKDWAWVNQNNRFDCKLTNISDDICLFAVQGPLATQVLQRITDTDLSAIAYYHFTTGKVAGRSVIISNTGYTGSGGFELYVDNPDAEHLWNAIIAEGAAEGLQPIGLGARDTLRLEMGFALYGT